MDTEHGCATEGGVVRPVSKEVERDGSENGPGKAKLPENRVAG